MNIQVLKDIVRNPNFLNKLDDVKRKFFENNSGCGCNNVKMANFAVTVCNKELTDFCTEFNINLEV